MQRYFFDIHDGVTIIDDEGVELANLADVRREALRTSGAMLRDKAEFWSGEAWKMEVRDESGKIVATLSFTAS